MQTCEVFIISRVLKYHHGQWGHQEHMQPTISPREFIDKWRQSQVKERSGYQEHFIDLCRLIGHPTPSEADPTGERFTFEAGATKQSGAQGWADVWLKGHFALEYKGKQADLDKAYHQLLQYREALQNPPLLIVSDFDRIIIHTNFTNTAKRVHTITLDDLLKPDKLKLLRDAFEEPERFRAAQTSKQVTEEAAKEFARLADLLRRYGEDPERAAHFLIRLLFCLFAEDAHLLPTGLFTRLVQSAQLRPDAFAKQLSQLFAAMAEGGYFGADAIAHFNGGLFNDSTALTLDSDGLAILARISSLDWSSIEPSIFGTLFERSLDPAKRAQLGAHYTSEEDILLIVEPVLMAPLRRKWEEVQAQARQLAAQRDAEKGARRDALHRQLMSLLMDFAQEIGKTRVLDPACGSGNFLYVSLRCLLDLEKEVIVLAGALGGTTFFPSVTPSQLYGIEINPYAHELAQVTVWIGYIQWLVENGFGQPSQPILKPLHNIKEMDAILAFDTEGKPIEPEWHAADVIIGNPPFLGAIKQRSELGNKYVEDLTSVYGSRIPQKSDLVCYWFEKARSAVEADRVARCGLIATQAIRKGLSRTVLDRISKSGSIFMAHSDRPWVLNGAAVRVSIIGFDNGSEPARMLDDLPVRKINPDLTSQANVTDAQRLAVNIGLAFPGTKKYGAFDIDATRAQAMLAATGNPNGRHNSDVVKPWVNGSDIVRRGRSMWIIDFGVGTSLEEASQYEKPFEYVRKYVKPTRDEEKVASTKNNWWLFERTRPEMRIAVASLKRYIATPVVSKYRLFVYLPITTVPDNKVTVIAKDDDYFMGILHSHAHEIWALVNGARHGVGNDPTYNIGTCFESFPFPWAPGKEPQDDPRVQAIAQAAKELVEQRDRWLNPEGATETELKKRTLTNLYNQRPTWLDLAHKRLDAAVFDAYGWQHDLSDEEILSRLLALNLERAKGQRKNGER